MTIRRIDPQEQDARKIAASLATLQERYSSDPSYTATQLGDAAGAPNTFGKRAGKGVWESTNKRPLWASGPDPTDAWNDATGSAAITPS